MSKSDSHQSNNNGSFLPAEYVKSKGQVRASLMAMLLFVLVLGGVVGAFVVNHQRWRNVRDQQQIVETAFKDESVKIEQLKGLEKQRNELLQRAEVVTALKDRVPRSVLVGEIVRGVPNSMTLTKLDLDRRSIRRRRTRRAH
jgi:Tfp pilus assembly protein PilN